MSWCAGGSPRAAPRWPDGFDRFSWATRDGRENVDTGPSRGSLFFVESDPGSGAPGGANWADRVSIEGTDRRDRIAVIGNVWSPARRRSRLRRDRQRATPRR